MYETYKYYIYMNLQVIVECPRDVLVKELDCEIVVTPVVLLRSLSDKYSWERYEPPHIPSYRLNSFAVVLLG